MITSTGEFYLQLETFSADKLQLQSTDPALPPAVCPPDLKLVDGRAAGRAPVRRGHRRQLLSRGHDVAFIPLVFALFYGLILPEKGRRRHTAASAAASVVIGLY